MRSVTSSTGYYMLLWSCRIVGALPAWFLYRFLPDVVYFLFYKVARYRVGVTRQNLARAFPDKTEKERKGIEKRFYRHLAEVIIDTIDVVGISEKEMRGRMVFENAEEVEKEMKDKNWIGALAHYGSWEYFISYQLYTDKQVSAVYRPLHNRAFDRLYNYSRSRFGLQPVEMHDILRYIISTNKRTDKNFVYALIADQTPPRSETPHWFDFLNQPTAFFMGVEKLAVKFGLPVYFLRTEKTGRKKYRGRFEMIYDGNEKTRPGEITERYVRKLESSIIQRPELWMWSHRRWKHNGNV